MAVLETSRLVLRPWTDDDAAQLLAVFSDAQAMRFWNTPPWTSIDEVKAAIRRSVAVSADHHAAWSIVCRRAQQVIGFVNYHHREIGNRRLEIGYILHRQLWRMGLTSEAVDALLAYCFDTLGVYRIEATVDPANTASIRFLERLGFVVESGPMRARMWTSDGRRLDAIMLSLLEPDWRLRAASSNGYRSMG